MNKAKRQIVLLAILFLTFTTVSFATQPEKQIVGEWLGTDTTGQTASFVFNGDGSAMFLQGDMVLNGAAIDGKVSWSLNPNHDPMHLDLIIRKNTGETMSLPMIVRFIGKNKIQARLAKDMQARPVTFSESLNPNQIVLSRQ